MTIIFCDYFTGMTDAMRNDFKLMDAMAQHTRISAQTRVEKLNKFNQRLYGEPKVVNEFRAWQLQLDKQIVNIPARILPETKIMFNNGGAMAGQNADWTNEFRNYGLIEPAKLDEWVVIVPEKLARDARVSIYQNYLIYLGIKQSFIQFYKLI